MTGKRRKNRREAFTGDRRESRRAGRKRAATRGRAFRWKAILIRERIKDRKRKALSTDLL